MTIRIPAVYQVSANTPTRSKIYFPTFSTETTDAAYVKERLSDRRVLLRHVVEDAKAIKGNRIAKFDFFQQHISSIGSVVQTSRQLCLEFNANMLHRSLQEIFLRRIRTAAAGLNGFRTRLDLSFCTSEESFFMIMPSRRDIEPYEGRPGIPPEADLFVDLKLPDFFSVAPSISDEVLVSENPESRSPITGRSAVADAIRTCRREDQSDPMIRLLFEEEISRETG